MYENDIEDILKAAGVKRSKVGKAAEGTFWGILATLMIVALVGSKIVTFLGAVGMVLKLFGAPLMASWSWGTLVLMLAVSTMVGFFIAIWGK